MTLQNVFMDWTGTQFLPVKEGDVKISTYPLQIDPALIIYFTYSVVYQTEL